MAVHVESVYPWRRRHARRRLDAWPRSGHRRRTMRQVSRSCRDPVALNQTGTPSIDTPASGQHRAGHVNAGLERLRKLVGIIPDARVCGRPDRPTCVVAVDDEHPVHRWLVHATRRVLDHASWADLRHEVIGRRSPVRALGATDDRAGGTTLGGWNGNSDGGSPSTWRRVSGQHFRRWVAGVRYVSFH